MASYPEIEALNKIYVNHQVEIEFSTTDFLTTDLQAKREFLFLCRR